MTESKQLKEETRFWHWVRVAVSFSTFGYFFPNAFTEGMDNAKGEAKIKVAVEKM